VSVNEFVHPILGKKELYWKRKERMKIK